MYSGITRDGPTRSLLASGADTASPTLNSPPLPQWPSAHMGNKRRGRDRAMAKRERGLRSVSDFRARASSLRQHAARFREQGEEAKAVEFEETANDADKIADDLKTYFGNGQSTVTGPPDDYTRQLKEAASEVFGNGQQSAGGSER